VPYVTCVRLNTLVLSFKQGGWGNVVEDRVVFRPPVSSASPMPKFSLSRARTTPEKVWEKILSHEFVDHLVEKTNCKMREGLSPSTRGVIPTNREEMVLFVHEIIYVMGKQIHDLEKHIRGKSDTKLLHLSVTRLRNCASIFPSMFRNVLNLLWAMYVTFSCFLMSRRWMKPC